MGNIFHTALAVSWLIFGSIDFLVAFRQARERAVDLGLYQEFQISCRVNFHFIGGPMPALL